MGGAIRTPLRQTCKSFSCAKQATAGRSGSPRVRNGQRWSSRPERERARRGRERERRHRQKFLVCQSFDEAKAQPRGPEYPPRGPSGSGTPCSAARAGRHTNQESPDEFHIRDPRELGSS